MRLAAIVLLLVVVPLRLPASDWHTAVGLEGLYYPEDPIFGQTDNSRISLTIQPEYRAKFMQEQSVFSLSLFYRKDSMDAERTHADIRQLDVILSHGNWEYQAGISKVFWGVTESNHLVDIINQTDVVENVDEEEKLGQPMLKLSHFHDSGSISFYILPYFRERLFPGVDGRLGPSLAISTDNIEYESKDGKKHVDFAFRWQQLYSSIDVGVSFFKGTSREPDLILDSANGLLKQFYPQIEQTGLELQFTGEEWLWKLESIQHRRTGKSSFSASTGGFEYTQPGIAQSKADLGLIAEYLHDSRNDPASVPFQNDLFLGIRVDVNDLSSTAYLIGAYFDLDDQSRMFRVERYSRLGSSMIVEIEAQIHSNIAANNAFNDLRNDSYVQLLLKKYF